MSTPYDYPSVSAKKREASWMYQLELTESLVPAQNDSPIRDVTIGDLLRETAANYPNADAMLEIDINGDNGRTWTYEELLGDSEKLALALSTRFQAGERITVWAPNIPEWLIAEYACALAGLILVTANPGYQTNELRYVLQQSNSVALLTIESYRGNPMADIARQACDGLDAVREIVDMEDPKAMLRHGDFPVALPPVSPMDAVQIQYTSGTTGFPKGAILHHRGLVNNARFVFERLKVTRDFSYANFMPMFHTSGCGIIALGCLQMACRLLMVKIFDAGAVTRMIEREGVNSAVGVPTMFVAMLEALEVDPRDMSSVKIAVSGGSMVAPDLVRRVRDAFGCEFETG